MRIEVMKTLRAHSERYIDTTSRAAPLSKVKRHSLLHPIGGSCPKPFVPFGSSKSPRPRGLCLANSSTTRIPVQPGTTFLSTMRAVTILCNVRLQSLLDKRHASPAMLSNPHVWREERL